MSEEDNIMHRGIWYGEVNTHINAEELWSKFNEQDSEREKLLTIVELLKVGEFSAKTALVKMMNSSKNSSVINLCVRVFCCIAQHKDIHKVDNLAFLSSADEEVARLFASCAKYTLSYETVPYLLAMLEEWEDTNVEVVIRDALDEILDYEQILSADATVDQIGELYIRESQQVDAKQYYYEGQLVFPGVLTKRLLDASALSRMNGKYLGQSIMPKMLSIWSGIQCPVDYYTIVDDQKMQEVFAYIKQLSKMNWKKGSKYFYGHRI